MSDLATVLARMIEAVYSGPHDEWLPQAMTDTPEGKALAALVEAALAWADMQAIGGDGSDYRRLRDAIDAYREATR